MLDNESDIKTWLQRRKKAFLYCTIDTCSMNKKPLLSSLSINPVGDCRWRLVTIWMFRTAHIQKCAQNSVIFVFNVRGCRNSLNKRDPSVFFFVWYVLVQHIYDPRLLSFFGQLETVMQNTGISSLCIVWKHLIVLSRNKASAIWSFKPLQLMISNTKSRWIKHTSLPGESISLRIQLRVSWSVQRVIPNPSMYGENKKLSTLLQSIWAMSCLMIAQSGVTNKKKIQLGFQLLPGACKAGNSQSSCRMCPKLLCTCQASLEDPMQRSSQILHLASTRP